MKLNFPVGVQGSVDEVATASPCIPVWIGGRNEWHRLWISMQTQLADHGVSMAASDRICDVLETSYLKWCPGRAVLIDDADRHTALPRCEELAGHARLTINGLFFELLRREIEIHRMTERTTQ